MEEPTPLILTLELDPTTFAVLNGLRAAHFPPERNLVPAHLTLFHALPGAAVGQITADLVECAAGAAPFALTIAAVRFLGRGVALEVASPALVAQRQELARRWAPWLTPQDRQGYRPHVTIQNKVAPARARQLHDKLAACWQPLPGRGEGLRLWRYRGGPWEPASHFPFAGCPAHPAGAAP